MAFHDDLLSQATYLANSDKGKPKQVNLRRAVSAAYYAIFHLLVTEGAGLAGSKLSAMGRTRLRRAYAHAEMRTVCSQYFAATTAAKFHPQIAPLLTFPISTELKNVAETFGTMQEARHLADYDLHSKFSRFKVLTQIGDVTDAFADWAVIRTSPNAKVFLMDLLIRKGGARQ